MFSPPNINTRVNCYLQRSESEEVSHARKFDVLQMDGFYCNDMLTVSTRTATAANVYHMFRYVLNCFGLNLFILHRLRNKFLQLILSRSRFCFLDE